MSREDVVNGMKRLREALPRLLTRSEQEVNALLSSEFLEQLSADVTLDGSYSCPNMVVDGDEVYCRKSTQDRMDAEMARRSVEATREIVERLQRELDAEKAENSRLLQETSALGIKLVQLKALI